MGFKHPCNRTANLRSEGAVLLVNNPVSSLKVYHQLVEDLLHMYQLHLLCPKHLKDPVNLLVLLYGLRAKEGIP
jgi:hypothetical protein